MSAVRTCPGLYCGRTENEEGWGDCGACPRGYRTNATSYCVECTDEPTLYDWQYLGFMVLLPLVLHWFFIDMVSAGKRKTIVAQHTSAFIEVTVGTISALFVLPPKGMLSLSVCTPKALSDWYTLLHNPQPDYKETLHCTQEAVYPLYTIVLLIYAFSLLMTVLLRPWILFLHKAHSGKKAIYCALYFYPVLVLTHTVAAGLIYCAFPYIVIIISMMTSASHFSIKIDQTASGLLMSSITNLRNFIILIGHWLIHAYGIISLTGFRELWYLTLVPTPALFYISTAQFSFPDCAFPYIIIIISMMTSASHFSIKIDQTAPALLLSSVTNIRNLIILIGHWLVHAYGIISLTGFKELWYLTLVPAPALFYILTAQFTDPMKIHND